MIANYSYDSEQRLPVFVYGSLRVGYHNSRLIDAFEHERRMGTVQGFDLFANGISYPFATRGSGQIVGEIVDFADKGDSYSYALKRLDALEGYDPRETLHYFYVRIIVTVIDSQGNEVKAWMYVASDFIADDIRRKHPYIPSGDWREWLPLSAFPRREVY